MENKIDLRVKAKLIRKELDIPNISLHIINLIRENELYKKAQNVMLFYPKKYEIDLLSLLDDNKNFYLPRVRGDFLEVCPFSRGDLLSVSGFNVKEPCSEAVSPSILDLVFVPALMVDKFGYRLGYGGGFYDRFLKKYPYINTILPISSKLIVEELPHDIYDCKVKNILSC